METQIHNQYECPLKKIKSHDDSKWHKTDHNLLKSLMMDWQFDDFLGDQVSTFKMRT